MVGTEERMAASSDVELHTRQAQGHRGGMKDVNIRRSWIWNQRSEEAIDRKNRRRRTRAPSGVAGLGTKGAVEQRSCTQGR